MADQLLQLNRIGKSYPGVVANDDISFEIKKGEIHALLGENGAGKSTLVKMIYGLVQPDQGGMVFQGSAYRPASPRAARAAGVAMVFQHFSLFEALSVAENIALGMDKPPKPKQVAARIKEVSESFGLPLSPDRIVGTLSAGERQRVEIIRCLLQNPKLLIMDEPTSVMTPQEVRILFETLRKLSAAGTAILYISHKLDEIRALCQTATILRRGKKVATCDPAKVSQRELAEMMVGQSFADPKAQTQGIGDVRLAVNGLSLPALDAFGTSLKSISLAVRAGEVLGIGGVAGNGQDELFMALSGEIPVKPEMIAFDNEPIGKQGPKARRKMGVLAAPEERNGHAAVGDMSLSENTFLTGADRKALVKRGILNRKSASTFANAIIDSFDVRTTGSVAAAGSLSGGNLQKFVIGREVLQQPDIFVVNQPTWGVDAAAAAAIRQALLDLAAKGAAVIVISQDLDELLEVSDRFAALCEGALSEIRPVQGLTMDQIGLMMAGALAEEATYAEA